MKTFDLYKAAGGVMRVREKPGHRFELVQPVTVKNKRTEEEIQITEYNADGTGTTVIHLHVGSETEALDPDTFEIVSRLQL